MESREATLNSFQEKLGYFFHDGGLLETALCHSSYGNENGIPENNERLEFLGDSVLGMAVAVLLYEAYPQGSEGELSSLRSTFVCRGALLAWAERLGLPGLLRRGKSMKGIHPPSLFSDAAEAVLGGVYLDGGYDAALRVVRQYLLEVNGVPLGAQDAKSRLQVRVQTGESGPPRYEILTVKGPPHAPLFSVRLQIAGQIWIGQGASRKAAELEAASLALKTFETAEAVSGRT